MASAILRGFAQSFWDRNARPDTRTPFAAVVGHAAPLLAMGHGVGCRLAVVAALRQWAFVAAAVLVARRLPTPVELANDGLDSPAFQRLWRCVRGEYGCGQVANDAHLKEWRRAGGGG